MKRDVFQATADPAHRAILVMLATSTRRPNTLVEHFDSSRQAVSIHLKILKESKLIFQQNTGREIYYFLDVAKMKEIDNWLKQFRKLWQDRFNQLDEFLNK